MFFIFILTLSFLLFVFLFPFYYFYYWFCIGFHVLHMGKKWSMHGKGMDHFGKENCDSPLVIGEREEERKEKLTRKGRWSLSEWD